jgi:leader peptidase (prepilin peptidase)/N-methyltransferase
LLAILIVGCGLFGLAIGSFLNVVIYRVPRGESIVQPRSHCPSCSALIKEYDNIPVVSWLILGGKCRSCRAPISPRYLLVELATGALFAGLAARMGYAWQLPAFLVLVAALLALGCIDLELLILPKKIVYAALALEAPLLVLASAATHHWYPLEVAAISAGAWFVLFFAMNLASPRILGFGDVRLAPLLGMALGWLGWKYVVLGFFAANFIGLVIGVALIAASRMKRDQPIPYGIFLAAGAAFAIYAGPELLPHFSNLR